MSRCEMSWALIDLGATAFGLVGLMLSRIQALGRWRSPLVIHYAGEAMHAHLPRGLTTADANSSAEAKFKDIQSCLARIGVRLDNLDADPSRPEVSQGGGQGWFVVNCRTKALHYTHASPAWDHYLQHTRGCGWSFASQRFERFSTEPPQHRAARLFVA